MGHGPLIIGTMHYVDVILPVPLDGTFTYTIDDAQALRCGVGMRVLVPFGASKTYAGVVTRVHDEAPDLPPEKVKGVLALMDDTPVVLPLQLRLWRWIADYYMCTLGDVYGAALPAGLKADSQYRPKMETCVALAKQFASPEGQKVALEMLRRSSKQLEVYQTYLQLVTADPSALLTREALLNVAHATSAIFSNLVKRGIFTTFEHEVGRLNHALEPHLERAAQLSAAQGDAYNQIRMQWMQHPVVLLHGVTSSGKTEVYIHLILQALAEGKQVLYLLPEIALTVQITQRLQRIFGNRLGIYHSRYSDAERVEIWRKQLSADPYDIILGVRSAVFLPFQRLGLVIVDEEHENSYKQQDPAPRYHARSAAIVLAHMCGAKTLLGTATPSAESYHNALTGKYGMVRLTTRFRDVQLPEIHVVDVKDLRHRKMMRGPFSPTLLAAMRDALSAGRQVILFQNRRGFAPMLECRVCGWVPKCKNCDVSLTFHKRLNLLTCHYCGATYAVPPICPNCENPHISGRGYGTENIEDQIRDIFTEARVARMDLDTTHTRNAYERLITDFSMGKTDVLIGTQMVSKGLDFGRVSVVGILDADSMLNYPDFRAYEHAFMMMSQVSGRAGRRGDRGLVILQTRSPQLPVVQQVVSNDCDTFYHDLFVERELFHYPPFTHLVYVFLRHKQEAVVEAAALEMGALLRRSLADRVLGPDKPSVARVKQLCIRKLVIKLGRDVDLRQVRLFLQQTRQQLLSLKSYSTVQIFFDVDPQ